MISFEKCFENIYQLLTTSSCLFAERKLKSALFFSCFASREQKITLLFLRGFYLYLRGEYKDAEMLLRVTVWQNHSYITDNLYLLGMIYIRTGRKKNSSAVIKKLADKNQLYCYKLDFEYRNRFSEEVFQISDTTETGTIFVRIYARQYREAISLLTPLQEREYVTRELYIQLLLMDAEYEALLVRVNASPELYSDYYAVYLIAKACFAMGAYKESGEILKRNTRAAVSSILHAQIVLYQAVILRYYGNYFASLRLLKKYYRDLRKYARNMLYINIALDYHQAGHITRALNWYKFVEKIPGYQNYTHNKVDALLIRTGDLKGFDELYSGLQRTDAMNVKNRILYSVANKRFVSLLLLALPGIVVVLTLLMVCLSVSIHLFFH